jgi:dsRNA-specific ribonuclease
VLEFLGDTTLNKSIAWYLSRKFPHLCCPSGVKILTRLKINLISKRSFARFAKNLHFWNFVSCDMETRQNKMDKTLEDVFEAFFGAIESILDERITPGVGYSICYNIISYLLDRTPISLKYEDLFDSKTRLKEIFDFHKNGALEPIGELIYKHEKVDRMFYVSVYRNDTLMGQGVSTLKIDAQQKSAEIAIKYLKSIGYIKPLGADYRLLCDTSDDE